MNSASDKLKKVLIIEDDATLRGFLADRFTGQGMEVSISIDGEDGLAKMLSLHPDATIIDVMLPKKTGFTVIDEFRAKEPKSPMRIIVLSNLDDMQYAANAMEKKAFAYIVKSDRSLDALASLIEEQLRSAVTAK